MLASSDRVRDNENKSGEYADNKEAQTFVAPMTER